MEENYQPQANNAQGIDQEPMTVGQWIGTFLLLMIPIANIILLFVWAFGGPTLPCRKNFAKAYLIIMLIVIGLEIVIFTMLGGVFMSMMQNY